MSDFTATLRAELAKAYEWGRMTAEQESPETLEQVVASGTEVVLNAVREGLLSGGATDAGVVAAMRKVGCARSFVERAMTAALDEIMEEPNHDHGV